MTDRQTERQIYFIYYYQNNKDKYKNNYRTIKYCNLCEKEFINITRHKTTQLHKLMVKKFPNISFLNESVLTDELDSVPSLT